MRLEGLRIAAEPAAWAALGFAVGDQATLTVGGVTIKLAGASAGKGIVGWSVRGLPATELDGLPPSTPVGAVAGAPATHPNGAVAVDHVVAVTGDLDRTLAALHGAGATPRRIRDVPGSPLRQAFFVLQTALLELAGPVEGEERARPWGLTVVVADLDALAGRLGARLGPVRDAVQAGRRIATLRADAGAGLPLAFMTPRPQAASPSGPAGTPGTMQPAPRTPSPPGSPPPEPTPEPPAPGPTPGPLPPDPAPRPI